MGPVRRKLKGGVGPTFGFAAGNAKAASPPFSASYSSAQTNRNTWLPVARENGPCLDALLPELYDTPSRPTSASAVRPPKNDLPFTRASAETCR